ncbi:ribonuclease domain-containing protein [Streptomyces werraensis]|uniref:ribonuclease domain-containing protein n=1 Tax=Streptomyces werraensis TaxID=68284 RepID=UPI00342560DB
MPVAEMSELPAVARRALQLIDEGGTFPYGTAPRSAASKGFCPGASAATVAHTRSTLGSDDRGARRIVTGRNGETYYTDDPYASFRAVPR